MFQPIKLFGFMWKTRLKVHTKIAAIRIEMEKSGKQWKVLWVLGF